MIESINAEFAGPDDDGDSLICDFRQNFVNAPVFKRSNTVTYFSNNYLRKVQVRSLGQLNC